MQTPTANQRVTMTYDKENRLATHERALAPKLMTYTYDGDGKKRLQNENGTLTTFVWDGDRIMEDRT
ncbi:MAG: hypothetical protein HONBIEJF_02597 [Fimbriimonadaceae bacterium]|nr:hypothetical protein [Fimbriimonadaceae bacterium]